MKVAEYTCNGRYGYQYLQILEIEVGNYNVETNKTPITIKYTNRNTYTSDANFGWANPATITITDADGTRSQNFANSSTDYRDWNVVTLGTWQTEVKHNPDGKLTLPISASFSSQSSSLSDGSIGGTVPLPDIPREAKITFAPNFNDEENPTIQYSNSAGNTVSSLQARIENSTGTAAYIQYRDINKLGNSYTFNLTSEERTILRNAAQNSSSLVVRFVIKTVIGNNTFWSVANRTMTIINGNPIFSDFDFVDINAKTVALTGGTHNNVKGYSNIRVFVPPNKKATAQKNASMSKYRFVIDTKTTDIEYSENDTVYGDINNSLLGIYNVYAIDSRNNSTLVTKNAENIIEYEPLSFNSSNCSVERTNGGVGEFAILKLSGYIWNDDFGAENNSIKNIYYQYKKTSEDNTHWVTGPTTITPTVTDNEFSFTGQIGSNDTNNTFDLQTAYDFRIVIEDELSTEMIELVPMPSGIPNLSLNDNGVGIMCDYDENKGGVLQIDGKVFEAVETYRESLTDTSNPNTKLNLCWKRVGKIVQLNISATFADGTIINNTHFPYTIPDFAKVNDNYDNIEYSNSSTKLIGSIRNVIADSNGAKRSLNFNFFLNNSSGTPVHTIYGSLYNGTGSSTTIYGTITYIVD